MEFPQQFPSLTIPTGAGPGQQRITINDGQDGAILVYDNTGALIVSIASAAGVDSQGTAYQAGVTIYSATTAINLLANDGTWTAADGSKVVVEAGAGASIFFLPQTSVQGPWFDGEIVTDIGGGGHPGLQLFSPSSQVNATNASIELQGGSNSSPATNILMQATNISINGDTWHAPSYGTNWSASTTFNGSTNWGALRYRKSAENRLVIIGGFKAGAVLPANPVFTLSAPYVPAGQWPILAYRNNGGTITGFYVAISAAGNFNIMAATGGGIAVNNEYLVMGEIPLD